MRDLSFMRPDDEGVPVATATRIGRLLSRTCRGTLTSLPSDSTRSRIRHVGPASSDGTGRPYKAYVRSPSFVHLSTAEKLITGHLIGDVVPIFGMINMIGGECDK